MKYKRTLGVDADGDIRRDIQGKQYWYDGVRGVKQELKITLDTVQGEQPFAEDFGLDVFEIAGAPPLVVRREIRSTLLDDDRVAEVPEIDMDTDTANRIADVVVTVVLVDGEQVQIDTEV